MMIPSLLVLAAITAIPRTQAAPGAELFDTSRVVTLQGTAAGFVSAGPSAPHFYMRLNVKTARGETERWLIEGKSRSALLQSGWTFGEGGILTSGDAVTVIAYVLKPDVPAKTALASLPPNLQERVTFDRVARGLEVTLANGRTLAFGDR